MTKQQILTKAIEKAEKNGWAFEIWKIFLSQLPHKEFYKHYPTHPQQNKLIIERLLFSNDYKLLLTDHDFCIAFWGEEKHPVSSLCKIYYIPNWQRHLQQMVITDDWLKYIETFLEEEK